jgi:hypothetical protein
MKRKEQKEQFAIMIYGFGNDQDKYQWFKKHYNENLEIPYSTNLLIEIAENAEKLFELLYPIFCRDEWLAAMEDAKNILFSIDDLERRQKMIRILEKSGFYFLSAPARKLMKEVIII